MITKINKNKDRLKRHKRVRAKIKGTADMPRLSVYRSLNHIYAQIIDDVAGNTIISASEKVDILVEISQNRKQKIRYLQKLIGGRNTKA